MKTTPPLFPLPKDGGSSQAPSAKTDEASVPSSAASPQLATSAPLPQPDDKDAGLGAANPTPHTAMGASAGANKSSKARKGPRRPRLETTMTQAQLARAVNIARRCSVSPPELVRNLLDAFGEKLARRAEAHAQAAGHASNPPPAE